MGRTVQRQAQDEMEAEKAAIRAEDMKKAFLLPSASFQSRSRTELFYN